jgi:hypothetical protein
MSSSETNSGDSVRTATATASEGRLDTIVRSSPRTRCISAKYVEERSSVMITRSTLMSRALSMSRIKSWVSGRGMVTPCRA